LLPANESDRLRIVLVSSHNPLNIGAAARAVSNFGFSHMRVVNPYEVAFREARSAVGAGEVLANTQEFTDLADAVADCTLVIGTTAGRARDMAGQLDPLEAAAPAIRKELRQGKVALLFGSEKRGLSNEDLGYCHRLIRIPTREEHPAMNLGQAVAVCLFELIRSTDPAQAPDVQRATAAELERISGMLLNALQLSGYVHANSDDSAEQRVRQLVRRLELRAEDADLWMGMLRQILWKLRSDENRS
jgi:tRNA/rRNA methyltransferase